MKMQSIGLIIVVCFRNQLNNPLLWLIWSETAVRRNYGVVICGILLIFVQPCQKIQRHKLNVILKLKMIVQKAFIVRLYPIDISENSKIFYFQDLHHMFKKINL